MDKATVFSILSLCFAPVGKEEWEQASKPSSWDEFLTALRSTLSCGKDGVDAAPIKCAKPAPPLQDFLSDREVSLLFAPPSYEEKRAFSARHFTGGLPASAVPVESLYVEWTRRAGEAFTNRRGLYRSDVASYMDEMLGRFGLEAPGALAAYPDHLSVELGFAAFLFDRGMDEEAWSFFQERSAWLPDYRTKLLKATGAPNFHLALIDALIGIRVRLEHDDSDEGIPADIAPVEEDASARSA